MPEAKQLFLSMATHWERLAAEIESAEALILAISQADKLAQKK